MKVKLEQLILSRDVLERLFLEKLPIRVTFRLRTILQKVEEQLKVYNESRIVLLEKHGKETTKEDGTVFYDVPDENKGALEKEHKELVDTEVTLGIEPLPINLVETLYISSLELTVLEWMFTE